MILLVIQNNCTFALYLLQVTVKKIDIKCYPIYKKSVWIYNCHFPAKGAIFTVYHVLLGLLSRYELDIKDTARNSKRQQNFEGNPHAMVGLCVGERVTEK
jgi:hypothetical protein